MPLTGETDVAFLGTGVLSLRSIPLEFWRILGYLRTRILSLTVTFRFRTIFFNIVIDPIFFAAATANPNRVLNSA